MYDSTLGRFLERDHTAVPPGEANRYQYVTDNPIRWSDPSGLQAAAPAPAPTPALCNAAAAELERLARSYAVWQGIEAINAVATIGGLTSALSGWYRYQEVRRQVAGMVIRGECTSQEARRLAGAILVSMNVERATLDSLWGNLAVNTLIAGFAANNKTETWNAYVNACYFTARCYAALGNPSGKIAWTNALGGETLKCEWATGDNGMLYVSAKEYGLRYHPWFGWATWEGV
jgi:hypothetical protein